MIYPIPARTILPWRSRDSIDLKFTVDGHTYDKGDLKGDLGRRLLKNALNAAWPENTKTDDSLTDMGRIFTNIFKEWKRNKKRATTLLILTDGVWTKTEELRLHLTILDIARQEQMHAGNRHFSIQFIRFGDRENEKAKLQWLDDELCTRSNLRDIIDHCSWRTTVDKMFKGSIEGWHDQKDPDELDIPYHYPDLVALFKSFNEGSDTLSPSTPHRTPSRSSSRSSNSTSQWRTSMPPERTGSWKSQS
ncbi:uncharacterized protein K460DRAFT_26711 [Cucurbitaria berberidis CBS 394.84]|uniref:VWFA domain-containing protein n=1 Tax=Cucurbitaria berberidis CBS 394.84 TaxID=1168544 RepID=A0A9P4LE45_9PLEO|nr:uncharacterized protein K460DRAFT_26711 [Cucurbitaria berberidis CBS 394.84]KAF1851032.1 hypothetical protein K460DRAFT_26711 [Cucurbitaria berberidis CBS 394.84]